MNYKSEVWLTAKEIAEAIKVNENTLRQKISRKKGVYKNIQSCYEATPNGRIVKYLASSLPTQWQESLQGLIQLATTANINALGFAQATKDESVIVGVGAYLTNEIATASAEVLLPILEALSALPADIDEFMQNGCSVDTAISVARKRAVVLWWRAQASCLPANHVEAFAYNVAEALKKSETIGKIGKQFFVLNSVELPLPKMVANQSASKMQDGVLDFLRAHYANGNRPTVKKVWEAYDQVRTRFGWRFVSLQTMHNWVEPIKSECAIEREGEKKFALQYGFVTQRALPESFGDVWCLDGTPANIWVVNEQFQPRQCGYKGVCVDVATQFVVAVLCKSETVQMYRDTFIAMVRASKRLPKVVQTDYFKGYKDFEAWLSLFGVVLEKPRKGNARAKVVESVLGHLTQQIERYNPAFSGLNTTAKEGRIGDEYRDTVAMPNAMAWEQARQYVEQVTVGAWNNHLIKVLGGAPCDKTPLELFLEKCNEEVLSNETFMRVVGRHHAVRVGAQGLQITTEQYTHAFIPPFDWGASKVGEWLMTNRGRKFDVYAEVYDAPVLVLDHETRKMVGWFAPVEKADYSQSLRTTEKGRQALRKSEAIRKAQKQQAKTRVGKAKQAFPDNLENLENLALQGDSLTLQGGVLVDTNTGEVLKGGIEKDTLNNAEEAFKLGAMPQNDSPAGDVEGVDWVWRPHPKVVGEFYKSRNPKHIQDAQK